MDSANMGGERFSSSLIRIADEAAAMGYDWLSGCLYVIALAHTNDVKDGRTEHMGRVYEMLRPVVDRMETEHGLDPDETLDNLPDN